MSSTRPKTAPPTHDGPSWEQAKRYEAYPTIKTRPGCPASRGWPCSPAALVIAALVLFFLPASSGVGGGRPEQRQRRRPARQSGGLRFAEPTVDPAPTQQTYTIKAGDTLDKIAKKFGLTVDQLLAANKQIKNPNKIAKGDSPDDPGGRARTR